MLFRPSEHTSSLLKRGVWIFLPLWIGSTVYFWLVSDGVISKSWNRVYFLVACAWLAIYIAHTIRAFASVAEDLQKSQHPDPDVADLIDGKVDIRTYRERREESAVDSSPLHDAKARQ